MKEMKLKKGTSGLTDIEFADHTSSVINGLTGNTNFPTPTPTMPTLLVKLDKFNMLRQKSQSADKSPKITLARNVQRSDIERDLSSLFGYVNSRGFTDIVILTSSGFPLSKMPDPVKNIGQCTGLKAVVGPDSGMCCLKVDKLQGAHGYLFQYNETLTPETANWVNVTSGDTSVKIEGLTPGTRYTFRVCGIRGKEMGTWSEYVIRYMS